MHPTRAPGPTPSGYVARFCRAGFDFFRFSRSLIEDYGDVVHARLGDRHHFFVNDADGVGEVLTGGYAFATSRPAPARHFLGNGLVNSQDALHRQVRRCVQPYFRKRVVEDHLGMIQAQVQRQVEPWCDGEVRDIATEMTSLALGVIARILFGSAMDDPESVRRIGRATHAVHARSHQSPASHCYMHLQRKLPFLSPLLAPARAREYLDALIYAEIDKRRRSGDLEGPDVLAALLRMQRDDESGWMSDEQIRHELMTMFFAGHETSAVGLAWTLYLLSQHPEAQARVRAEIHDRLGSPEPGLADLQGLAYTGRVWNEALRLYPPVWGGVSRRVVGADALMYGRQLPRNAHIFISPYLLHHNARYYREPERFDPERFAPEAVKARPRFAFIPFGGGHRHCIGANLAWAESMLALATIVGRFRLRLDPRQRVEVQRFISLKPKFGLRMRIETVD